MIYMIYISRIIYLRLRGDLMRKLIVLINWILISIFMSSCMQIQTSTITADFDSMYNILADIELHKVSIENQRKQYKEGIYIQSYKNT